MMRHILVDSARARGNQKRGGGAPKVSLEQAAGVGIRHYDGHGQFTQIDNVKGSITGIVPTGVGKRINTR